MRTLEQQVAEARDEFVGRSRTREQYLDPASLQRFAVAVGYTEQDAPGMPMAHWAWFNEALPDASLGPDGHAREGGFLPVFDALPRRMYASSRLRLIAPLRVGEIASEVFRIDSISHKPGRSGDLAFVEVVRRISQSGALCVEERQALVFRAASEGAPDPLPQICDDALRMPEDGELWCPGPVQLFRFSAVTFNPHRIHYDVPYVTEVERYPALIVHGPFTSVKLACLAARGGRLAEFSFRALQPLFCGQPVRLVRSGPGAFSAVRCDGAIAMRAEASFG